MNYGFIGLGNLASAIIKGMVKSGSFKPENIRGYDISEAACRSISQAAGIGIAASNAELVRQSDVIIIAVKPQMISAALQQAAEADCKGKLFISIAAAVEMSFIEGLLGQGTAIVRVMPNINAKVGAATSGLCFNPHASAAQAGLARDIFNTVGTVTDISEQQMSTVMAINGASPAFAYMYIDALARAGVKFGLPKKLAMEFAASTVFGSAKMVMESGEHPFELIDQVCSPGGTTIEGIMALQELGFESAVHQAIEATVMKDRALMGK